MTHRNDIENELRKLGSTLADCDKAMPYHIPENYFDRLPDVVMSNAITDKTIQADTSMPYDVPENYFNNLPDTLLKNVKKEKKVENKRFNLYKTIRWAAAATLLFAIGIGSYQIAFTPQTTSIQTELAQLPEDAITQYISDHIDDFDTDILAGNINTLETDFTEINDDAMESYLEMTNWQQIQ